MDPGLHRLKRCGALALLIALAALASGCAVKSYQRERLTDRIMRFESDAEHNARTTKWLEAREGSTGGNGGAGGGCACN